MKRNLKNHISKYSIFLSILFLASPVFAVKKKVDNVTPEIGSVGDFIQSLLGIAIRIGVPIATIFIIWSGYLFVSAQGDTTKIASARKTFVWACIGLAVLLGAWAIASAIQGTISSLAG